MALPQSVISTVAVELSGGPVDIRGLTFDEAKAMVGERANAVAVGYATGCTEAEAAEWLGSSLAGDVTVLLDAILDLSGLGDDAQFQDRPGDVSGDARGAE